MRKDAAKKSNSDGVYGEQLPNALEIHANQIVVRRNISDDTQKRNKEPVSTGSELTI